MTDTPTRIVPREATPEMVTTGALAFQLAHQDTCYPTAMEQERCRAATEIYRAMFDASPPPAAVGDARELLAQEMEREWVEFYRDRETGRPPSKESWLDRASNAPASIRAIERALSQPVRVQDVAGDYTGPDDPLHPRKTREQIVDEAIEGVREACSELASPPPAKEEVAALLERLRAQTVIKEGEPVTLHLADGTTINGNTGDIVCLRNPDGPEAADLIERLHGGEDGA